MIHLATGGQASPHMDTQSAVYDVARDFSQVLESWRLVYQVYNSSGLIGANPYQIHAAPQLFHDQAAVFHKSIADRVVATFSAVCDGESGLPLDEVYRDELDDMRASGRKIVEIAHLAVDSGQRNQNDSMPRTSMIQMTSFTLDFAREFGADDLVIGIHPKHQRYYERAWGYEKIGAQRRYPIVNLYPVVMMRLDWRQALMRPRIPYALRYSHNNRVDSGFFDSRYPLANIRFGDPSSEMGAYIEMWRKLDAAA